MLTLVLIAIAGLFPLFLILLILFFEEKKPKEEHFRDNAKTKQ